MSTHADKDGLCPSTMIKSAKLGVFAKTKMSGAEFVKELLAGERDFTKIELEHNFHTRGRDALKEVRKYLKENKPNIDITNSNFRYFAAKDLEFYNLKAINTNLTCANFKNCKFYNAEFSASNLRGARFDSSYFKSVNFVSTNLELVAFCNAEIHYALFEKAHLNNATFHGAKLIDSNLLEASLEGVTITNLKVDNVLIEPKKLDELIKGELDDFEEKLRLGYKPCEYARE